MGSHHGTMAQLEHVMRYILQGVAELMNAKEEQKGQYTRYFVWTFRYHFYALP
ncbi:MAG TPA: hypothetical protein H9825_12090 [Candidatus Sphingobacterium stercorigallinarum]|nr:hypothetical protein [Candidatus Sphingobacterium stercorigallinarum]